MYRNWKLWAGLGLVTVVVAVLAPAALIAVVPILLVAGCPLSMLIMARGVTRAAQPHDSETVTTATDPR
jgi:hypothetical protein